MTVSAPSSTCRPFAARCFHKPLGYAGDFEMMNMLYRNESLGDTLVGRSLSRVLLDSDAGQAVRTGRTTCGKIRRRPGAAGRTGRRESCRSPPGRRWNCS